MPYRFRSVPSSMLSCRHTESDLRIGPYLTMLFHVPVPLLASLVSYCLVGKRRVLTQLCSRRNEAIVFVSLDVAQPVDNLSRQPDVLRSGAEDAPALQRFG